MRILIYFLILAMSVFFAAAVFAADQITTEFKDDFNDLNISDWQNIVVYNSGDFSYVEATPFASKEGGGSFHFFSDSAKSNRAYAKSPKINFISFGSYNVSFWFMIPNSSMSQSNSFKVLYNGFLNLIWDGAEKKVFCDEGGGLKKNISPQLSGDAWYNFEVQYLPEITGYRVFVDGEFQGTCGRYPDYFDNIIFGDDNPALGSGGEAYWDLVEVKRAIDITAPAITILSPANASISSKNFAANVSLDENATSCTAALDSAAAQNMNAGLTNESWSLNMEAGEGSHSLKFSCADASNNIGEKTVMFSVDTIAPAIKVFSPKNATYAEDFVDAKLTTDETAVCKYKLDGDSNSSVILDTADGKNFSKKADGLSGAHKIIFRCSDAADNFADSLEIFFTVNASEVSFDIDSDSTEERAENSDGNVTNGFENYTDPNGNSNVVNTTDADADGRIDFFINTTGTEEPEIYWDPDNAVISGVDLIDVNSDGKKDFIFDSDGDSAKDKWYNPSDGLVSNYTPPPPPQPQPPSNQGNPGGTEGGGPGGSPGGVFVPLKENLIFVNPPSIIPAKVSEPVEFDITLSNTGNKKSPVSFSFAGAPSEWFSVSPSGSNISAGESTTYKVKIIPQQAGNYSVNFSVAGESETIEIPLSLFIEAAPATTATTAPPITTTTTAPPSGITGAIVFLSNNPAVSGGLALVVIIAGSILWSVRRPSAEKAREVEEKIAEQKEAAESPEKKSE